MDGDFVLRCCVSVYNCFLLLNCTQNCVTDLDIGDCCTRLPQVRRRA